MPIPHSAPQFRNAVLLHAKRPWYVRKCLLADKSELKPQFHECLQIRAPKRWIKWVQRKYLISTKEFSCKHPHIKKFQRADCDCESLFLGCEGFPFAQVFAAKMYLFRTKNLRIRNLWVCEGFVLSHKMWCEKGTLSLRRVMRKGTFRTNKRDFRNIKSWQRFFGTVQSTQE